ncbi:MAG: type II toxin-antitoxin system VapC family toxin [Myxococcota bacterium]
MIALDTNVLVRLVTQDDPRQVKAAKKRLGGQPVFVAKTVVLELAWVLESVYELDRDAVHRALDFVARLSRAQLEDSAAVRTALDAYRQGADFADALHVASSPSDAVFVTFDRALTKRFERAQLV